MLFRSSRNLSHLLENQAVRQSTLTPTSLLSDGQVDFAFQTTSERLLGLALQYGEMSAGLLMPAVTLEDWQGVPLCQRLTTDLQSSSLYLTCNTKHILSESAPNPPDKVKSILEWSELISDGRQIEFR